MYSSGYSQVNKFSPEGQKKMTYRSKGKSCGYYMRIVFFFSSLIQSLIIVSLVLFLIYGNKQDTASAARSQDLEESFSRLSIENVALRQQRANLRDTLNATITIKARNEWDLNRLRQLSNISIAMIQDLEKKLQQCNTELFGFMVRCPTRLPAPPMLPGGCNCGLLGEQMKAQLVLVQSNFTETTKKTKLELEQLMKEKETLVLENIRLRRDKSVLEKAMGDYSKKAKDEFSHSLSSVSSVSKALLGKIDSLFPSHLAFQMTCPNQRDHLSQIHYNCTKLSREVEGKLQDYMNNVGEQVSNMQAENVLLKAENWRLSEDYRWCSQNRTGMIEQHKRSRDELQRKHDDEKERLMVDKMKLDGEIQVLKNSVKYKSTEVDLLKEQMKQLNASCAMKTGQGGFLGASRPNTLGQNVWNSSPGGGFGSSSSSYAGQVPRNTGLGVSAQGFNSGLTPNQPPGKPASTGLGSPSSPFSSFGSSLGLSNTGSGNSKPASTGLGSPSSPVSSSGSTSGLSSTGSGKSKPASTGLGSPSSPFSSFGSSLGLSNTGSGNSKPGSTGLGSPSSPSSSSGSSSGLSNTGSGYSKPGSTGGAFSSSGAAGSSLGSSGTGLNKPLESGRSPTNTGSAGSSDSGLNKPTLSGKGTSGLGTSGQTNKSGSTSSGFSWLGFGSSSSGKTGSVPGKTTSGNGYSGTGTSAGGGRTSGTGSYAQHVQELQRLINPPGPQEKQELSRMLG